MEQIRAIAREVSNWNRWGKEDELGAVNLITPEAIVAAAGLIKQGKVFDLGIPLSSQGPQSGGKRFNPVHLMTETGENQVRKGTVRFADDFIVMPLQSSTQWDGLAHCYYDDLLYNGWPASTITIHGAQRDAIDKQAKGIVGRGVLLDIARIKGVDWLEAGYVITPEDLDAAAAKAGAEITSGTVLLIRTGARARFLSDGNAQAFKSTEAGLGIESVKWLREKDVAVVCSDNNAIEVKPHERDDIDWPLHMLLIRDMGLTLGEIFDLEELAADCEEDGVREFFFAGPPLKVAGGVGSPVNPLAIK